VERGNPCRKPGVALVLRGRQGTGKTVLVDILRTIIGPANTLVTPDKDRILGRFNSAIMNKILLVGEEMLFAGDRATTDKLKHLITGQTIPVEFKFGDTLRYQVITGSS
jgi:phage/plasmid-associated DNA primase